MTTVVEVAERLARRLKKGLLPELSVAESMDIVEALNAGLQECYELLPSWQRRTTVSVTLGAPVAVNLSVVNGSVDLAAGGSVFLERQIGRSVVVSGDDNWNEVQSTTQLLDEYQGTTGVKQATIYGDSAFNDITTFEGLLSHPIIAGNRCRLLPFNARAAGRCGEVGEPRYYWVEPAAASLGGAPHAFLRVSPAPDRTYVLRVDMEFRPSRIKLPHLVQGAEIALQEQLIDRALIPLAELRLMRSPQWADRSLAESVREDAATARAMLVGQRSSVSVPSNSVGTPAGW